MWLSAIHFFTALVIVLRGYEFLITAFFAGVAYGKHVSLLQMDISGVRLV